jgi:hypothetical protein
MQFSTSEEHVQLVERAKALLARQSPGKSLGELHLQAMRLLVATLEKQRYGAPARALRAAKSETPTAEPETPAEQQTGAAQAGEPEPPPPCRAPRQRGRYVPAAVRRAVLERDGARCTYVDERGERCPETHFLELHHRLPFAKDGPHDPANLTLHCPAHNALAAERDFGSEHMAWSASATHAALRNGRPNAEQPAPRVT